LLATNNRLLLVYSFVYCMAIVLFFLDLNIHSSSLLYYLQCISYDRNPLLHWVFVHLGCAPFICSVKHTAMMMTLSDICKKRPIGYSPELNQTCSKWRAQPHEQNVYVSVKLFSVFVLRHKGLIPHVG